MKLPSQVFPVLLLVPGAPALAQSASCFLFPSGAEDLTCSCGPGPYEFPIWGSGPYSTDSHICTAAVHAGVIGPEGGEVTVLRATPPEVFQGTTANGITSQGWAEAYGAFVFKGGDEKVLPVCDRLGEAEELTCRCDHGAPLGSVWGSGPYAVESDICTAARHAGVIGHTGGEVRVQRAPGQASYAGSLAGGVTTFDQGASDASFTFVLVK